jgi:uncharacterized protein YbcV (DUF1398 family)
MDVEALHQISVETQKGRLTFPQTVHQLLALGVESYFVDLATARKNYYLADGRTHTDSMILDSTPLRARSLPPA